MCAAAAVHDLAHQPGLVPRGSYRVESGLDLSRWNYGKHPEPEIKGALHLIIRYIPCSLHLGKNPRLLPDPTTNYSV